MKKVLSLLLSFALICALSGCTQSNESPKVAVNFYYCTPAEDYETIHQTIFPEIREGADYGSDLQPLLNDYLRGPVSENLVNPFPESTSVESLAQTGTEVCLVLSSRFARLTGIDLILASSCISYTVFELTGCQSVRISVDGLLLDGDPEIVIRNNDILLDYQTE